MIAHKILFTIAGLTLIVAMGIMGTQDQKLEALSQTADLENQMSTVCHAGNTTTCQSLIQKVQADGQHEVLTNAQGYFWTETK